MNNRDFISNAEKRRYEFLQKEKKKPLINRDRLELMTNEELAKQISKVIDCGVCKDIMKSMKCPVIEQCGDISLSLDETIHLCEIFWLDWLKKEVKDV